MNVEIGAEAALFPEKEYVNGIAVAVRVIPSVAGGVCFLAYKLCWPVSFSAVLYRIVHLSPLHVLDIGIQSAEYEDRRPWMAFLSV
jgi:hypothetical protein